MFIGRKAELEFLNSRYNSDKAEFITLYGRRRVGKTELLVEFCKDKPHIFYTAKECTDHVQLQSFSSELIAHDKSKFPYLTSFENWEDAFGALAELDNKEKRIIVIDEFPYMVKGDKSIPSILQMLWDHKLSKANVMLVLSGSSMSFMENEILGYKNALYGRMTGIYKLEPLPFYEAVEFFPNFSNEDKITAYGILGGVPQYLKQFNDSRTLEENVKSTILKLGTPLSYETEFLLREELREPTTYNSIILAIALGASSLNEIYGKTKIEQRKLSVYLKNLLDLGIVQREFSALSPVSERANAQKGIYSLTDNFFKFWYAYCYPNLSLLQSGNDDIIWKQFIENDLHHFTSRAFEKICIEYVHKANKNGALPFCFSSIARWWGKVTKTVNGKKVTTSEEIDILATDREQTQFLLGECKFTNEPFDLAQLKKLQEKYPFIGKVYYYLFSLNGFTNAVIDESKKNTDVRLVSLDDIFNY